MSCNDSVDEYLESVQKHIQTENKHVNDLYKQLLDYEETLKPESSDDENHIPKIMDLLNTIEDIKDGAEMLRPINKLLENRRSDMEGSLKSLQQTIDLFKLEQDIKRKTEKENLSNEED